MRQLIISIVLFQAGMQLGLGQVNAEFQIDTSSVKSFQVRLTSRYVLADTMNHTFLWDFGDGATSGLPNVDYLYNRKGTYRISFTVSDGSFSDMTSHTVHINTVVEVPNVFTPNNDGFNDLLVFRTNGKDLYSVEIYSRTGSLVFRQSAYTISWDGKNPSGEDVYPGVYYYVIQYEGKYISNGFFHLIR